MIKEILDEIASESSTNKKMEILSKYKDNDLLKEVIYLACSKRVKFYIKQIPNYDSTSHSTLSSAISRLDDLTSRKVTGGEAINHLAMALESLNEDDGNVLERIIEKDLKIGMGTSNINKVFPNLIEKTPYMGAKPFSEDLVNKILEGDMSFSQVKMDGRYANAIIRGGEVELESRQGEPTILGNCKLIDNLSTLNDCVLNGELTIDNVKKHVIKEGETLNIDGVEYSPNEIIDKVKLSNMIDSKKIKDVIINGDGSITVLTIHEYDRYTANGIVSSIIDIEGKRNERSKEETQKKIGNFLKKHGDFEEHKNRIIFTIWDMITVDEYFDKKSLIPYNLRFFRLIKLFKTGMFENIKVIRYKVVTTYDEAMNHFKEVISNGEEGTILKSFDGIWKDGKPNWQIKLKVEINLDLIIKGFNYGTGKNKDLISSLNVETSDGLLKTSPAGISEVLMMEITKNQHNLLDTIVEVKSSGLSQDRDGNWSLLHPVFKKLRDDKETGNTLDECVEIYNSALGLK